LSLFSQRSELIKDAAPWIDDLTFVPLEPILPHDKEVSRSAQKIFQMLGVELFVGGVHTLIILGSVCLARRTTDDQCTVCGSCGGAIAMVCVGSIAVVGTPICFSLFWSFVLCNAT